MRGTRVTCMDIETGESEARTITDDYLVVCDGKAYVDSVQVYANGTAVVTIRKTA